MATTVVHLKRAGGAEIRGCDLYISRPMYQGGWRLPGSRWVNPFKVGRDGTLEEVLAKFESYVRSRPDLMGSLGELRGKRLGCWCVDSTQRVLCHGQILVRMLAEVAAPVADDDPLWEALGL